MQALILAGGLGTRMSEVSPTKPKALIPIHGQEFLYYQLNWLTAQGVTEVVISIGHMGDQIRSFVSNHPWSLQVHFVEEGPELRGTGGAIKLAQEQGALQKDFALLYGDSFLQIDLQAAYQAFKKSKRPALMCIYENRGLFDKSNVQVCGDQIVLYDKFYTCAAEDSFNYIDYGLSFFKTEVIEKRIPSAQKYDLAQLFHELSQEGLLSAFTASERFFEIGSKAGLYDFEQFLLNQKGAL